MNVKLKLPPIIRKILSTRIKLKLSPRVKKILKWVAIIVLTLTVLLFWIEQIYYTFSSEPEEEYYEDYSEEDAVYDESCNVVGIELRGDLYTYISNSDRDEDGYPLYDEVSSEEIVYAIEEAEKDNDVKAIILEIDSGGGFPVAAEEITHALQKATKPTVALIREFGDSAAYWAATGADIIFASENSDVGSIGVTMSYMSNNIQNQKDGLTYNQLSAGKFKDMGDPDKVLTYEEKQLLMRDVDILHENFIKIVAENRDLDISDVRKLADGSSMLGKMALENGLIDKIGGLPDVVDYLSSLLDEEIELCW